MSDEIAQAPKEEYTYSQSSAPQNTLDTASGSKPEIHGKVSGTVQYCAEMSFLLSMSLMPF